MVQAHGLFDVTLDLLHRSDEFGSRRPAAATALLKPGRPRNTTRGPGLLASGTATVRASLARGLPAHQGLHGSTHPRRPVQEGDHPLPEALRRPRGVPRAPSQPRTRTGRLTSYRSIQSKGLDSDEAKTHKRTQRTGAEGGRLLQFTRRQRSRLQRGWPAGYGLAAGEEFQGGAGPVDGGQRLSPVSLQQGRQRYRDVVGPGEDQRCGRLE